MEQSREATSHRVTDPIGGECRHTISSDDLIAFGIRELRSVLVQDLLCNSTTNDRGSDDLARGEFRGRVDELRAMLDGIVNGLHGHRRISHLSLIHI